MEVSSVPGEGSSFVLIVPCAEAPPMSEMPMPSSQESEGPRLQGLRILAAEDNEINQLILENLLLHEGARLTLVSNGRLAVEAMRQSAAGFDVVLMDVQMSEMDGLEATRLIRERCPDIPIIGQTAHALAEEHARCHGAGMNYVVTKPINIDDLVAAILHHSVMPAEPGPNGVGAQVECTERVRDAIDWGQLRTGRFKSRPEFLAKILRSFGASYGDAPSRVRALAFDDINQLSLLAHNIKGSAGFLLAHDVVAHAQAVEESCHIGSDDIGQKAEDFAKSLECMLLEIGQHEGDDAVTPFQA